MAEIPTLIAGDSVPIRARVFAVKKLSRPLSADVSFFDLGFRAPGLAPCICRGLESFGLLCVRGTPAGSALLNLVPVAQNSGNWMHC